MRVVLSREDDMMVVLSREGGMIRLDNMGLVLSREDGMRKD